MSCISTTKKYYYVYRIVNKINQHEYIGFHSTNDLDDGYMGSGKLLQQAYKKHGIENFEKTILKIFKTKEEAEAYERELVNEDYVNRDDTYNLSLGGNVCILFGEKNGFFGKKHSKESIDKMVKGLNKYYETHDGVWKERNQFEDDDVIVDGVRYFSFSKAMKMLNLSASELSSMLVLPGNGFVDQDRQKNLLQEIADIPRKKELARQHIIERNRKNAKNPKRNAKISKALTGKPHPWQDKVNKNPVKIAKTAAKHRGMKRSKQTCENISTAKKLYFEDNDVYNKDMIFIHNLTTNERTYINEGDPIPDGWELGLGPTKARGKKWYMNPNDLTQSKNFGPDEQIPEGWVPGNGGLRLAREQKRKLRQQQKELANGSIDS